VTAPQRYTHIRTTRIVRTLNGGCGPRPSGRLNALVGPIASAVSAPGHDVSARRQRELQPCRLERGEQLLARDRIAAYGCHGCQHRVAFSRPYQRLDHPACEPLCCQTSAGRRDPTDANERRVDHLHRKLAASNNARHIDRLTRDYASSRETPALTAPEHIAPIN
jgi:hypothetical protein